VTRDMMTMMMMMMINPWDGVLVAKVIATWIAWRRKFFFHPPASVQTYFVVLKPFSIIRQTKFLHPYWTLPPLYALRIESALCGHGLIARRPAPQFVGCQLLFIQHSCSYLSYLYTDSLQAPLSIRAGVKITQQFWVMTNLMHSFLMYLFYASTRFEQQVLIIRRAKLY
jgi:hypothetical protein